MLVGLVSLLVVSACPTTDLGALASPPLVRAAADGGPTRPDFVVELASKRSAVVPSTVVGPFDLGADGALVAAVRCSTIDKHGEAAGACEIVIAHLAPVGLGHLELSGLVGAFPARGKHLGVSSLAARDLLGGDEREVVVRWRSDEGDTIGLLRWDGFTRLWQQPRARDCAASVHLDGPSCAAPRLRVAGCGAARAWRWDPRRAELVKASD